MAHRWLTLPVVWIALLMGCDDGTSAGAPRGGAGGSEWVPACQTGALCGRCPDTDVCESDTDCVVGFVCIESGCSTNEGATIKQCAWAPAGACRDDADCSPGRACTDVPGEGQRCVKTTPGCDSTFDCVLGFSCEEGACVDRRVPCFVDAECPKSHVCHAFDATRFCLRVHQSCEEEFDCENLAARCDDVDGDGRTECAPTFNPNVWPPEACLNSMCAPQAPVCELTDGDARTRCGEYGLCVGPEDCVEGFDCVGLWPDGRRECVPSGGSCAHVSECPVRQVCASPREGGPPRCQGGVEPG